MDYHELTKLTVGKLREMAEEHDDLEGVTGMAKEQLIAELCKRRGIEMPHKVVVTGDKSAIKAQIKDLKKLRDQALEARDRGAQHRAQRGLHKLRRRLRRATKISAA